MPVSIPSIKDYRGHISLVIHFMMLYLLECELADKPNKKVKEIVSYDGLKTFGERMFAADPDTNMELTDDEIVLIYSSYDLMNKILLSSMGEALSVLMVSELPAKHWLKKPNSFRDEMLMLNTHLINDSKKKVFEEAGMVILQGRLNEVEIE